MLVPGQTCANVDGAGVKVPQSEGQCLDLVEHGSLLSSQTWNHCFHHSFMLCLKK